jgi:hypothetical protein
MHLDRSFEKVSKGMAVNLQVGFQAAEDGRRDCGFREGTRDQQKGSPLDDGNTEHGAYERCFSWTFGPPYQ